VTSGWSLHLQETDFFACVMQAFVNRSFGAITPLPIGGKGMEVKGGSLLRMCKGRKGRGKVIKKAMEGLNMTKIHCLHV
jgi:hypothetical protein